MAVNYFPAIIEGGLEPGYSVFFPDLPGCTSAGDTIEQAALNAEEALRGHLNLMIRDGEPIPIQRSFDSIEHDPEVLEIARLLLRAVLPGIGRIVSNMFETMDIARLQHNGKS